MWQSPQGIRKRWRDEKGRGQARGLERRRGVQSESAIFSSRMKGRKE